MALLNEIYNWMMEIWSKLVLTTGYAESIFQDDGDDKSHLSTYIFVTVLLVMFVMTCRSTRKKRASAASNPQKSKKKQRLTDMSRHTGFTDVLDQSQSTLFQLPGEVRQRIFTATLSGYEDKSRAYDKNTYWCRPEHSAPLICDTALLQTCKKVYDEAWHIPWLTMTHSFWLGNADRSPRNAMSRQTFARTLQSINFIHGQVELEEIRYFAQLWALEAVIYIQTHLDLSHFHPRSITITIRHTDWWYWESNRNLKIDGAWVRDCRFPESVRTINLELETIEQKKTQLDYVVGEIKRKWYLKGKDGSVFSARETPVVIARWKGSSTWSGKTWTRDETEPGIISYYINTITFRREYPSKQEALENYPSEPDAVTLW